VADGIIDRLVHNAHRIEMRGDSMRKNLGKAVEMFQLYLLTLRMMRFAVATQWKGRGFLL
jgi:hypothetical protein